jgi:hypothetical protein
VSSADADLDAEAAAHLANLTLLLHGVRRRIDELRRSYADSLKNERKLWLDLQALKAEHAEALRLLQWLFRTGDPGVKGEPRWNARAAAFELLDRKRREDPSSSWPAPE